MMDSSYLAWLRHILGIPWLSLLDIYIIPLSIHKLSAAAWHTDLGGSFSISHRGHKWGSVGGLYLKGRIRLLQLCVHIFLS